MTDLYVGGTPSAVDNGSFPRWDEDNDDDDVFRAVAAVAVAAAGSAGLLLVLYLSAVQLLG